MDWGEFVGDIVEEVVDVGGKIEDGFEYVAETADRMGLGKLAQFARVAGKVTGIVDIAPTPILVGGQKAIDVMKWSTGEGEPEGGEAFGNGSRAFKKVAPTLHDATPNDNWEGGSASGLYARRNGEQEGRVVILADADIAVAGVIANEADQIRHTRTILDNESQFLADFGKYSQWLGSIPRYGKVMQAEVETAAVLSALQTTGSEMWDMHNNANTNAKAIKDVIDNLYKKVSDTTSVSDSNDDFDPPAPRR
jgi:hypothetical protein